MARNYEVKVEPKDICRYIKIDTVIENSEIDLPCLIEFIKTENRMKDCNHSNDEQQSGSVIKQLCDL